MSAEQRRRRLGHSARRWLRLIVLSAIATVTFKLLLPLGASYIETEFSQLSDNLLFAVGWILVTGLLYAAIHVFRIRLSQMRHILRYPPLWAAAPIGLSFATGLEPWQDLSVAVFVLFALVTAIFLHWSLHGSRRTRPKATPRRTKRSDAPSLSWDTIKVWIQVEEPITSADFDFFGHQLIADRVERAVRAKQSVALLGGFGTGKTSILKLTRSQLGDGEPLIVVAHFDVWSVPKPEDVPRLALNCIVTALDEHIDTFELRTLPLTYRRLLAAEPTGWIQRLLRTDPATDSIEALERLSPVLDVLDARLVLIVEDVERAGKEFDTRHLGRLLWALRRIERASFILAMDPARVADPDDGGLDYVKLCDTPELVPAVDVEQVARIVRIAYGYWRTEFSACDIDPHRHRPTSGRLRIPQNAEEAVYASSLTFKGSPADNLVAILQTPRALKHVLRRVNQTWQRLHGEAELDDIIVLSAIRHGSESAYKFLLENIDAARQIPRDDLPESAKIKDEWDGLIEDLSTGAAVRSLVGQLGIRQLVAGYTLGGERSPQDVSHHIPTDYFRRIVAENIGPSEIRDQDVLQDIDLWKEKNQSSLVGNLVAVSKVNEQYALVWEHFSERLSEDELRSLTEQVVAAVLDRDGPSADGKHPAMIAVWRRCNRRLQRGQDAEWLVKLALRAVPVSLNLVNKIFYFWTGKNGIVTDTQRNQLRRAIGEAVRNRIRTGEDLVKTLAPEHPSAIRSLVDGVGTDTSVEAYRAWRDHLPAVLIEGAKIASDLVLAQFAVLAGDKNSGWTYPDASVQPAFVHPYKMDRDRMAALFGDRLDEALELLAKYEGDDPYAKRATEAAATWLRERRAQS